VNGIACGRRVAKLHGPGRYFLCRHCYRLGHASQVEDRWDRALRRANNGAPVSPAGESREAIGPPCGAIGIARRPSGSFYRTR
jgi:hypothetical protein